MSRTRPNHKQAEAIFNPIPMTKSAYQLLCRTTVPVPPPAYWKLPVRGPEGTIVHVYALTRWDEENNVAYYWFARVESDDELYLELEESVRARLEEMKNDDQSST